VIPHDILPLISLPHRAVVAEEIINQSTLLQLGDHLKNI